MIPAIHEILEMVKNGQCTVHQANGWIELHMERSDLLDHIAALALPAVIAAEKFSDMGFKLIDGKTITENTALCAYHLADAMVEARKARSA